jgi:aminopeptidase-like protein
MGTGSIATDLDTNQIGCEAYNLISELYPICRSITGDGCRETLRILRKHIPLEVCEVPTGTKVFDWVIPREWNIRDAYIKNSKGQKIVDFNQSNLHVVNYSSPVQAKLTLQELQGHLYSDPAHPDWIPYRTSYYKEDWGFCIAHKQLMEMPEDEYEVRIDSSLTEGRLTYGEYLVNGKLLDEVLISCHICHPSLCNDNLSGIAVATFLAKHLSQIGSRYSYRFLFVPGAIGPITWLAKNEACVHRIKHGLVLANLGDSGKSTYKKSRRGNAFIDRAVHAVLKHSAGEYEILEFSPYGYDERQYCSPGFNLPVGLLTRTPHGRFPQYHTSADNLDLVQPPYLADSFSKILDVIDIVEHNGKFLNTNPRCEPFLGKRNLYRTMGGLQDVQTQQLAMLWVLNLSDGEHDLLEICERSGLAFTAIWAATQKLAKTDLLVSQDE